MIARIWHGAAPVAKSDAYLDRMRKVALPDYKSIAGNRGAYCLHRVEGDVAHFSTDTRFDAAVGRYILQFLPDPVAALRSLSEKVRPGGTIAFQEGSFAPFVALSAHLPLWSAVVSLHHEVALRVGVNTEMGPSLHRVFQNAGLPAPSMR